MHFKPPIYWQIIMIGIISLSCLLLITDGYLLLGILQGKGGLSYNFYIYSGYTKDQYSTQTLLFIGSYLVTLILSISALFTQNKRIPYLAILIFCLILLGKYLEEQYLINHFVPKG